MPIILLVEDDPIVALDAEYTLHELIPELTLGVVCSYNEAVAWLAKNPFLDCGVLDFNFPGATHKSTGGVDLCSNMKVHFPNTPLISVSGTDKSIIDAALREAGIEQPFTASFPKPVNYKKLAAYIIDEIMPKTASRRIPSLSPAGCTS